MSLQQLITSLDIPEHMRPVAEAIVAQAKSHFTSNTQTGNSERVLNQFLKSFSSLEPTSEDFYKVRDFIIEGLPQFEQSAF